MKKMPEALLKKRTVRREAYTVSCLLRRRSVWNFLVRVGPEAFLARADSGTGSHRCRCLGARRAEREKIVRMMCCLVISAVASKPTHCNVLPLLPFRAGLSEGRADRPGRSRYLRGAGGGRGEGLATTRPPAHSPKLTERVVLSSYCTQQVPVRPLPVAGQRMSYVQTTPMMLPLATPYPATAAVRTAPGTGAGGCRDCCLGCGTGVGCW